MISRTFAGMLVAAALLLGGCASVPMANPEADASAKTFSAPTNGKANLYIYRNETMGSAVKLPLLLDGVAIGDTTAHTYVFKQVSPGKHTVTSKAEKDATLDVEVAAGKNYFVWQEVKMGMWAAGSALHQVDDEKGKTAVKECKMIQ